MGKKNWYRIFIFFIGLFLFFSGCYKDKGNYKYQPVNDITIGLPDTLSIQQGLVLSLNPTLTFSINTDTTHLTYQWVVTVPPSGVVTDSSLQVISTDKGLNAEIDYSAGSYYPINFKITDTMTGITYRKQMTLAVISHFQPGYFLLEKDGSNADVSFVNTNNDSVMLRIFSSLNPNYSLPTTVRSLNVVSVRSYSFTFNNVTTVMPATTHMVLLYQGGGYVLDYRSMKVIADYSSMFNPTPSAIDPTYYACDLAPNLLTINNGHLYRDFQARAGVETFGNPYTAPDDKDMYLAPYEGYIIASSGGNFYYDTLNHRFLKEQFLADQLVLVSGSETYNFTSLSHRTFMGMKPGYPQNYYTYGLFKDNATDSVFLYTFAFSGLSTVTYMQNSPGIASTVDFVVPTNRQQLYYSDGNKLYLYDMGSNSSRIVYTFPSGENITKLYLMSDNYTLAVATYGSIGKLYVFTLAGTGDANNNNYNKVYSGFGEIVSIGYKSL